MDVFQYLILLYVLYWASRLISSLFRGKNNIKYNDYLKTNHWAKTRRKALERGGNRCALCGCTSRLQVHHNNYKNLWREDKHDLVVLCDRHHKMVHNK